MTSAQKRRLGIVAACFVLALIAIVGIAVATSAPTQAPAHAVAATHTVQATKVPTHVVATPKPTVDITTTPAYQLASIDNPATTPDDKTLAKYNKVLASVSDKTGSTPQQIADGTVAGQGILHDHNYSATLLDLLNAVDGSITKQEHQKFPETLAAIVTLMTSK